MPQSSEMPPSMKRRVIECYGVRHVLFEWEGQGEREDAAKSTILLLHGYMDAAGTWTDVAGDLAARGHRVVVPNLRGFGEGSWNAPGSYYHFPDYVFDVASILETFESPPHLVGHSMGGTIAALVAGAFPTRIDKLALLEGLGPASASNDEFPERTTRFVVDMQKRSERRFHRPMKSEDEAVDRLRISHPTLAREILARAVKHLVVQTDAGFIWRFDPLHRVRSATAFFVGTFTAHLRSVQAETLLVSGGARGFHPIDEKERASAISRHFEKEIADAGHMLHWTKPHELAHMLSEFFTKGAS